VSDHDQPFPSEGLLSQEHQLPTVQLRARPAPGPSEISVESTWAGGFPEGAQEFQGGAADAGWRAAHPLDLW
jgi:hypothetical protein